MAWLYLSRKFIVADASKPLSLCKALALSEGCGRLQPHRVEGLYILQFAVRGVYAIARYGCAGGVADSGSAVPSSAQYFGRNKVQYERFDFKVLATEHFDIYYYPEEEAAVRARRANGRALVRAALASCLQHELSGRQPLILYAAHPHFQQTNILDGEIGEGTGGVTESIERRVILPFAGGLAETDHVLGHELVHAFQYDMASQVDMQGRPIGPGLQALPLWFIEGMAEYLSIGPIDSNTAMWVREAASRDAMPSIDKLDDPDFFPYRYGHAFWAYVAGRWGDRVVGDMLRATGPDGNIEAAIAAVLGVDDEQLTQGVARRHAGDRSRRSTRRRSRRECVRPRADLARAAAAAT